MRGEESGNVMKGSLGHHGSAALACRYARPLCTEARSNGTSIYARRMHAAKAEDFAQSGAAILAAVLVFYSLSICRKGWGKRH